VTTRERESIPLLIVLVLGLLAFVVTSAHGQQVVTLPTSVIASTCRIQCSEGGGRASLGTGTLVAKDDDAALVVTCWHLFADAPRGIIGVTFGNGEKFMAKRLGHDEQTDLALLEIQGVPSAEPIPIADASFAEGSRVFSAGFGQKGMFQATDGSVRGYFTSKQSNSTKVRLVSDGAGRGDVLGITGAARQGDSGGPIFDEHFQLAGVLWGGEKQEVDGTHCVEVMQFIQRCPGGNCPTPQYRQPPQRMTPPPPKPQPPAVAGCKCGDCCKENAALIVKLEARLAILEGKIADGSLRGAEGKQGEPGPRGLQGPQGPTGMAGKDADLSTLPPITFHNLDPMTGKPKGKPIVVHLGEHLGMVHQTTK
jgi:hypothetical protein